MQRLRFLALTLTIHCFGQTGQPTRVPTLANAAEYKLYNNERYGFFIQYPRSFIAQRPPDNGDGQEFKSADGTAALSVYGANLDPSQTIRTIYEDALEEAHGVPGYSKVSATWFVISWQKDGKIVYQKTFVGMHSRNTFVLTYPASRKEVYAEMVRAIGKSFQPGDLSQSQ